MNIAIVTGASSGIGREFALRTAEKYTLDEIWLIARSEDRLNATAQQIKTDTAVIPLDLTKDESLLFLRKKLTESAPSVKVLINCAGFGNFGTVESQSYDIIEDMIALNVRATTCITKMCIPYMLPGSAIINVSSVSGFIPLPYMNVYSASKAYILRFSQALSKELESKCISVTAVCPYWVSSEFISIAQNSQQGDCINNFRFITYPYTVVNRALKDANRAKTLSLCGTIPHLIRIACAVLPFNAKMKIWEKSRRLSNSQCSPRFPVQLQSQEPADRRQT